MTGNNATGSDGDGIEALLTSSRGPTSLSISNSTISGNSASISNFGNGGGLFISAQTTGPATTPSINVSLTNSTVEGNSAGFLGGGMEIELDSRAGSIGVNVSGSTFDGNSAGGGGAIDSSEESAGVGTNATVTVTNSTIYANSAFGGGGISAGVAGGSGTAGMALLSDTIAFNLASSDGGGVAGDHISVDSSIIADNVSSFGPDAFGAFTSLGHNLIGQTDGSSGWIASDLTGTTANPLDPMFGTFGNNGGPTNTLPVLAGSPTIGNGDPAGPWRRSRPASRRRSALARSLPRRPPPPSRGRSRSGWAPSATGLTTSEPSPCLPTTRPWPWPAPPAG